MKKHIIVMSIKVLLIISILIYGIYWLFYDIQRIEGQEIIEEAPSSDGTYTVTAYLNNGGATVDYAVLCSVKNNGKNREKNIYWQYHCKDATVVWVDEVTVRINDIELNVEKDIYDYRHD